MPDNTPAASAQAFADSLPPEYRSRFGPAEIAAHAHVFYGRDEGKAAAGLFPWPEHDIAALCIAVEDRPGLLALISRSLSECGFQVESAEAYCREGEPRIAVDFFWLRDVDGKVGPDDVAAFAEILNEVLAGKRPDLPPVVGTVPPGARDTTVRFLEQGDGLLSVLEVETADRSGLLWAITRALHGVEVQILGSQIRTAGARVQDRFTIAELSGAPIGPDRRLKIQVAVLSALEMSSEQYA